MIVLTIRTDKVEAELGVYDDQKQLAYEKWQAHRQLSETISKRIDEILNKSSISRGVVEAIVIYKGPGSFTGLRIGFSVANAYAYAHQLPIIASDGENWISDGIEKITTGNNNKIALPEYGFPPHITEQKK